LGVANWLTIGRGFLIAALGGFLFQESPGSVAGSNWLIWVPGAIYTIAAVLDYVDGFLARAMRSETRLGEWLDTQIDALSLLVAPILAIGYDRLPSYYIGASLAYYIFQAHLWHRKKSNGRVIKIKPHPAKRMIAGFQMGLVATALLPIFPRPALTVAATIFMIPLLAGFIRDAFVSAGHVKVNHLQQTRWDRHVDFVATRLLPVFLRLIICATVIFIIYDAAVAFAAGKKSATVAALDAWMPLGLPALPILAAAGIMVALGFLARSMALLMGIVLAGTLMTWDSPICNFVLLACALTLTLSGSGMGSLWQPENKLLWERQGQSRRP
jgi:CDP-diacylglycerol--glycerol-3-phosphate 3-phosphatidyltransferase